ncbi:MULTISPECIES: GntR family transcriptional regulator [Bacillus]|uniref:GntR family transcriptional regulator n=1 Tax=Bacillus TaxID=1386 RepID=UPI0002EFC805|nr:MULTISPECIES: GntR family transcriptional regulator [Bacillus]
MDTFSIEKPMRYYDQVYHSIREMIVKGVLKPGDGIYEARIARELNISRSPVREAVRALEKEGLLEINEKSRITVYKPTIKDIEDIYQCRIVLESLAASLTTRLATKSEIEEIESTLVKSRAYLENYNEEKKDKVIEENARFHDLIMKYSQNRRLNKQLSDLKSLSHYYRVLNFQGENREWNVFYEHQEIFNHIVNKEQEKAYKAMQNHMKNDLIHLREIFGNKHNLHKEDFLHFY